MRGIIQKLMYKKKKRFGFNYHNSLSQVRLHDLITRHRKIIFVLQHDEFSGKSIRVNR